MAIQDRNYTRQWRYSAPRYCTGQSASTYGVLRHSYESVDSYRGKRLYITVGKKRREVFHAFTRYKYAVSEPCVFRYCPQPSKWTLEGLDFPMVNVIYWLEDESRIPGSNFEDSQLPLMLQPQLQREGENLREFVIRDLYAKANAPRFDGAVFLAELDETLVGVHKLLSGCAGSLFKSGKAWKHIKHFSLNTEELWLWWRYMLMPTMMEVEDLLTAIKPQERIDRVQDGDRLKDQVLKGSMWHKNWNFGYQIDHMEIPWKSKWRAGLGGAIDIYSRSDPYEWGTSPWDVVRAGWERIPFSFVADWFVNVGDWLSSLRELEIVYAQSYSTYAINSETRLYPGPDQTYEGEPPIVDSFLMSRIVDLEPPKFPLVDKRWRNILRTIDLISLTVGILKGVLKTRRR